MRYVLTFLKLWNGKTRSIINRVFVIFYSPLSNTNSDCSEYNISDLYVYVINTYSRSSRSKWIVSLHAHTIKRDDTHWPFYYIVFDNVTCVYVS